MGRGSGVYRNGNNEGEFVSDKGLDQSPAGGNIIVHSIGGVGTGN
jgi:hypothetical protein